MATAHLTAERLRELLHYDPQTGVFTWAHRPIAFFSKAMYSKTWNTKFAGKRAQGISNGYYSIRIENRAYWSHRLAWLYVHGNWPVGEIDHINGEKLDNRLCNLRDVSRTTNQQNQRDRTGPNKTLPLGVCKLSRNLVRPYKASVGKDGVIRHLGYFATAAEAHDAYLNAKRETHEGCTI